MIAELLRVVVIAAIIYIAALGIFCTGVGVCALVMIWRGDFDDHYNQVRSADRNARRARLLGR